MRRFVYGLNFIDEVGAQVMPDGDVRYVLQDANYNVVGIFSESGQTLIRQFAYTPYGELIATEDGDGNPLTGSDIYEAGHLFQGLWCDEATGLCFARGHEYNPPLARFLQRDPNQQALMLANVLAMNGQTRSAFATLTPDAQYLDGMNPFLFAGSNAITGCDPSGLSIDGFRRLDGGFDWWAETQDVESNLLGHKLGALADIQTGAGLVLMGSNVTLGIAGSLLRLDLLKSARNVFKDEATLEDAVTLGFAALPVAGGAVAGAWKAFKWFKRFRAENNKIRILRANNLRGMAFERSCEH